MFRQGFLTGLLILALVLPADARIGQGPSTGTGTSGPGNFGTNCSTLLSLGEDQQAQGPTLLGTASLATSGTPGLYVCHLIRPQCSANGWTKLGAQVTVGLAAQVAEIGVFTSDGATRLFSSGSQSVAVAGTISGTIAAFNLVAGTQYLVCWVSSAAGTVSFRIPYSPGTLNNLYGNTTFTSGALATQVAPFNEACTAGATPYTCCTGLGTGTCLGMADRTGVPGLAASASGSPGPWIRIAP